MTDKVLLVLDKNALKEVNVADLPALFPPQVVQAQGAFHIHSFPVPDGTALSVRKHGTWYRLQIVSSPQGPLDVLNTGESPDALANNLASVLNSFGEEGKQLSAVPTGTSVVVLAGSDLPGELGNPSMGQVGIDFAGSGYVSSDDLSGGKTIPQDGKALCVGSF